jgi:YegS/Rv2252/BmrU family lipid kinase
MYLIVFNPTAGAGRSYKALGVVEQILKEKEIEYKIQKTEYKEHAVELAKNAAGKGYKGVISVGGDGTLLEVAQALQGTGETLGIIPAGTGNDFRESVGVPPGAAQAMDIILAGHSKSVDVGLISGEKIFLNVAGCGFDVDVIKNTAKVRKVFTGGFAYLLGIIMSILGHKSVELKITADGKEYKRDVLLIAVANGKCYGGGLKIAPSSSVSDGLFNIVIINRLAKHRILLELPKLKRGQIEKISAAEQFICKDITIDCDSKLSFNLDGEVWGETPMTFAVKSRALSVFCPENI